MVYRIFKFVEHSLSFVSQKTKLTYQEINVLLYFFIIPFSWFCMLDNIFKFNALKIYYAFFIIGFIAGCRNFRSYCNWLFYKSVEFLNYFNRYSINYFVSSVWICVILPIAIYSILLILILT